MTDKVESSVPASATASLKLISFEEMLALCKPNPGEYEIERIHGMVSAYNRMMSIISKMDFIIEIRIVEGRLSDPPVSTWRVPNFLSGYKDMCRRSISLEEEVWLTDLVFEYSQFAFHSRLLRPSPKLEIDYPMPKTHNGKRIPKKRSFDNRRFEEF